MSAGIRHCQYQVKPHLAPLFSATCAAAIVHRNYFLHLNQKNKSFQSKVKFRQASNCCKGFLKLANLHLLLKKESIISQKLGSQDSWQSAKTVLNHGKPAVPPLFNGPEMLSSAPDKEKGSILGPTFFLLYINDFLDDVICNIAIYADDTVLYSKCDQASDLL